MKNKLTISLMLGCLFFCTPSFAVDVLFFEGSLAQVENQAAREGKLYFVDFYANWCLPCKWMDETTFTDQAVANYLKQNYVPAKVNIDNFDGYAYKEKYNVHVLPTFIIFNSSGEIVGRYEESLPPSKMLAILQQYDLPENRIKHNIPSLVVEEEKEIETPVAKVKVEAETKVEAEIVESPEYSWNDDVYRVPAEETAIDENEMVEMPIEKEEEETNVVVEREELVQVEELQPERNEIVREEIGLYNFSVSDKSKTGFAVQVGVYREYSNVLQEAARYQMKYGGETIVHIEKINGNEVYKLMLGSYDFQSDAQAFLNQIVESGGEALLKDLSTL